MPEMSFNNHEEDFGCGFGNLLEIVRRANQPVAFQPRAIQLPKTSKIPKVPIDSIELRFAELERPGLELLG